MYCRHMTQGGQHGVGPGHCTVSCVVELCGSPGQQGQRAAVTQPAPTAHAAAMSGSSNIGLGLWCTQQAATSISTRWPKALTSVGALAAGCVAASLTKWVCNLGGVTAVFSCQEGRAIM
jgi:hypothetical protein